MPSSPGIRMSTRHTSGRSRRASSTAALAVGGLADDLDVGLGVKDHRQAGAHQILVVGHQHAHRHRRTSVGSSASTAHPPSGAGPARSVPPSSCTRSVIPSSPKPWLVGRAGSIWPSSVTRSRSVPGALGDPDLHTRGVAGVPQGVGQRLLSQPVDRRVELERKSGQVTCQLHVDDRDRVTARERHQVGDARLGGVLRSRSVAQHPDHRPHLRQRPRRFALDDRQRLERRLGSLPGHRSAGLRLHCDRRDVVGDRVVQLAREADPLLAADLVQRPAPALGAVTERRSARPRRQQDAEPAEDVGRPGVVGDRANDRSDQHHRQANHDLAP